ncbi:IS630 family transposase [Candidatus Roizmanbacteria bacterium CG03_land_8_20_14_0_80_39_12]|uniref:IS630 family transposase n=1 Tax=Candidatus Roizmanbacteria bacterium CG03_land_8_20_14_0_80_39_12 TaxID=1974847 RepID=A0A2M7BR91_9BACT|nr:MAG: IS630 family transposase [Candidatus Roizmanbacteria bacterium CG03_land_8_20_14_0_80_39_12]
MGDFLTEGQVKVLKLTHRTLKDKKLADRIKAILSLNSGHEYSQVATILLLDEVTLRRYVEKFKEKGMSGLLEYHYTGGRSQLNIFQQNELRDYLQINTQTKAKDIVLYVKNQYKISYSVIGITKLLHRLGFSYKKPKVIPGKADYAKQKEFLDTYKEIKSKLKTNDQIYFLDSTHPQHNTTLSYGWILKGHENDKFIKTNTGRERLNLTGAFSLSTYQAVVKSEKTINSQMILKLLNRLIKLQPQGKIHLVLDNASYYHADIIQDWKSHHYRVKFHFLPPYSPNLNLIERLWRFFHQKITNNHYFETYAEFKKTSLKFFRNLDSYKEELTTLMTDNFQLVPNLKLQT